MVGAVATICRRYICSSRGSLGYYFYFYFSMIGMTDQEVSAPDFWGI